MLYPGGYGALCGNKNFQRPPRYWRIIFLSIEVNVNFISLLNGDIGSRTQFYAEPRASRTLLLGRNCAVLDCKNPVTWPGQ
jgi:hypothetical protein